MNLNYTAVASAISENQHIQNCEVSRFISFLLLLWGYLDYVNLELVLLLIAITFCQFEYEIFFSFRNITFTRHDPILWTQRQGYLTLGNLVLVIPRIYLVCCSDSDDSQNKTLILMRCQDSVFMMIYAQPHSSSPTLHSLLSTYINFLPEPEIDAWPLWTKLWVVVGDSRLLGPVVLNIFWCRIYR